ncbi:MAG: hypothetical protein FD171_856 [Actinobacteria bacterium]|nr:MAG: hypothetical protein FD171_856 [Actinomycetota bacterium]
MPKETVSMPYRLAHAFELQKKEFSYSHKSALQKSQCRIGWLMRSNDMMDIAPGKKIVVSMPHRLAHAFELDDPMTDTTQEDVRLSQCRIGWLMRSNRESSSGTKAASSCLNAASAGSCVRTHTPMPKWTRSSSLNAASAGLCVRTLRTWLQRWNSTCSLNAASAGSCVRTWVHQRMGCS